MCEDFFSVNLTYQAVRWTCEQGLVFSQTAQKHVRAVLIEGAEKFGL